MVEFSENPLVGGDCHFSITKMSYLALCVCITFMFSRRERKCLISVMQIAFLLLLAMLTSLGMLTGCCIRRVEV